jgi:hypothetical protein
VALSGSRQLQIPVKRWSYFANVAPESKIIGNFISIGQSTQKRRTLCENRSRDWSPAAGAKEHQLSPTYHQKLGRGDDRFSPSGFGGHGPFKPLMPDFKPPEL